MPTISLCMIVKNEEMHIARCLDSVAELVEEIVIVDTGSTDRTVEIVSDYTSKVYSYPWKDDFSDFQGIYGLLYVDGRRRYSGRVGKG